MERQPPICGWVIRYGEVSDDGAGTRRRFMPGAFAKSLRKAIDIPIFWRHNRSERFAARSEGTVRIEDRKEGVHCDFRMLVNRRTNELFTKIQKTNAKGLSASWTYTAHKWDLVAGHPVMSVTEATLTEVSICPVPAFRGCTFSIAWPQPWCESRAALIGRLCEFKRQIGLEPSLTSDEVKRLGAATAKYMSYWRRFTPAQQRLLRR